MRNWKLLVLAFTADAKLFDSNYGGINSTEYITPSELVRVPFERVVNKDAGAQFGAIGADYVSATLVGTIGVGTPPQPLVVLFDTGSSLFWVRSSQCTSSSCAQQRSFNNAKSSTYKTTNGGTQQVTYGDGTQVICTVNSDTVTIGNFAIQGQPLCEATSIQTTTANLDGIIGLGPSTAQGNVGLTGDNSAADVFQSLATKFSTNNAIVSFWYNLQASPTAPAGTSGEITFGGIDPSRYTGQITWFVIFNCRFDSVSGQPHWAVNLNSISIGGNSIFSSSLTTFIDTGTTAFVLPTAIVKQLNAKFTLTNNGYVIPCSQAASLSPVTFGFGNSGLSITLSGNQQVAQISNNICLSIFSSPPATLGSTGQQYGIAGALFINQFYNVFDYGNNRVGFATPVTSLPSISSNSSLPQQKNNQEATKPWLLLLFISYIFL
ncbi:hypothetical protein HK103_006986 [Boothiomyces macroporosus]|uniref:rhizopuspepsin n=1 Tax=Boothiomyces macroporosus TaxID=261099 RepID=A0AAD5UL21_9FUNG|nr:hypothetical protein HK103_006986 [Boothiomyces macroporosus]